MDFRIDYGVYQPFYEKLLEKLPCLCQENELFQFALPVRAAGWDDIRDLRMYYFLDSAIMQTSPFFMETDLRYSSVYQSYLESLCAMTALDPPKKLLSCLDAFTTDSSTIYGQDGIPHQVPSLSLSGSLKDNICEWETDTYAYGFRESFSWQLHNAEYQYEVSIKGIGCYEILRGAWFDETLLYLPQRNFIPFFDSLRLMPVRILVIHKLTSDMQVRLLPVSKTSLLRKAPARQDFIPAEHDTSILGISSKIIL